MGSASRTLYQPIVDVDCGGIAAFEAFGALDKHAVATACTALNVIPPPLLLTVTVSPATLRSHGVVAVLSELDAHRLVLVVPGRAPIDDYEPLLGAMDRVRSQGARVGIDGVGATIDHMTHVSRMRPDVIKFDRSVVAETAAGGALAAHARGVVRYATGADIPAIATGIDGPAELAAARALGVRFGQGSAIADAQPLDDWCTALDLARLSA